MLCAIGAFAVMDLSMKHLVATYPALQVSFIRGIASLPLVLLFTLASGQHKNLFAINWPIHLLRGLLGVGILASFVYSLSILSLSDAYSIRLCGPLLITAMSVLFLREKVTWKKWLAVATGLTGVLIILRPTGSGLLTLCGLAAFATAFQYAISSILIRVLARTDSAAATVLWTMIISTVVAGMLASLNWVPIQSSHWPWIAGIGVAGAFGQYLLTLAFRLAPAATVAPFEYTALLWGLLFDWIFWTALPSSSMLIGAAIVVISGLYVIRGEKKVVVSAD
ncbi:MAG: rane protein [Verrucomicrobiaceae bacterium]|nr:rane protein [Verrucomicrobiaceae bacterium]